MLLLGKKFPKISHSTPFDYCELITNFVDPLIFKHSRLVGGWTTRLKNMLVKLDRFPTNRGENSKNVWVATTESYEPGSKLLVLGLVIQPFVGNPYNGAYKPLRNWVDEFIPYYMEMSWELIDPIARTYGCLILDQPLWAPGCYQLAGYSGSVKGFGPLVNFWWFVLHPRWFF